MGKPRNSWVAGILTFMFPGLGHVYCGEWWKGIKVYPSYWFIVLCGIGVLVWIPIPRVNVLMFMLIWGATNVYVIKDVIATARRANNPYELRRFNRWYVYIIIMIVVGLGHGLVNQYVINTILFRSYKIPVGSMAPTLVEGDHVVTDKLTYRYQAPKRGDIVIFKYPEDETKQFLKRIIGMPGETIQIKNKTVYVNEKAVDDMAYTIRLDPGIIDGSKNPRDNFGPTVVPPQSYFVLGDNRDQSLDSRFFGSVEREKITGKVNVIYFSIPKNWPAEKIKWARIGLLPYWRGHLSESERGSTSMGGKS